VAILGRAARSILLWQRPPASTAAPTSYPRLNTYPSTGLFPYGTGAVRPGAVSLAGSGSLGAIEGGTVAVVLAGAGTLVAAGTAPTQGRVFLAGVGALTADATVVAAIPASAPPPAPPPRHKKPPYTPGAWVPAVLQPATVAWGVFAGEHDTTWG